MAEFTARPEFRGEWVEQVKQIIDNKKSVANAGKFPRVATPLLDAKPEAYIPNFVSLGPYHHWKLEQKIAVSSSAGDNYEYRKLKMSSAEAYKVESAATFWRNRRKGLDDIIEKMKGMRQDIEEFYDWPISADSEYAKQFALMMAIDSSFLLRFLFSQSGSFEDGMKNLTRLQVSIKCDILKLENQIPLSILSSLFDIAKEDLNDAGRHEEFSKLLKQTYKELSPFEQFDIANSDPKTEINKQPHLLGCVHALISPLLDMKVIGEDNVSEHILFHRLQQSLKVLVATVFPLLDVKLPLNEGRHYHHYLNLINAGELRNGGIKFKSFSKQPNVGKLEKGGSHRGEVGIRFDKYSGTLYLPQITVSEMQTEVFFRNMLALEFNDAARGDSVTRYVGLMDCLIDTPEDVRLLRESQVILRGSVTLTDEKIAAMWNGLCHPIFTGHLEPPEDLNGEIGEVLISKHHRKVIREFYWDHLSEPVKDLALLVGKVVALLIGIRLLRRTLVRLLERAIGNFSDLLFKRPFGTLHQLLDIDFGRSLPVIFKFKTATRISKRP